MKMNYFLSVLFFLLNAVQFNIVDDNGGGSDGGDAGDTGSQDSNNDGQDSSSNDGNSGQASDGNQSSGDNSNSDQVDLASLPEGVQNYIKGLRKENAKYRTDLRGTQDRLGNIENGLKTIFGEGDDQVSPEDQIAGLQGHNETLSMQNAVLGIALQNGMNVDQAEYFQFLLQRSSDSLAENEELEDEAIEELIAKAKMQVGGQQGAGGSTSADGTGKKPPQGNENSTVTLEQFNKMGYMEKVNLKKSNEALYNKLFSEAVNSKAI